MISRGSDLGALNPKICAENILLVANLITFYVHFPIFCAASPFFIGPTNISHTCAVPLNEI